MVWYYVISNINNYSEVCKLISHSNDFNWLQDFLRCFVFCCVVVLGWVKLFGNDKFAFSQSELRQLAQERFRITSLIEATQSKQMRDSR